VTDPADLELARLRARGDQLRSTVRDALAEMESSERVNLFRICAKGDLSGLDERTVSIVAWLALVAMFDLGEDPAGKEGG
jgi:hypothetical protein